MHTATTAMRRGWSRALAVIACALAMAGVAHAQDITGTWQGTLQAGKEVRVVFTVANAGGALSGLLYAIDQSGQGIAATAALQGTTVRLTVAAAGLTVEGRLSADATAIIGTWSQGGASLPLTLTRATPATAWAIPKPPAPLTDAEAVFDVATIKPSNPDAQGKLFTVKGRQVLTINTTVNDLLSFAYGVQARQIAGGPPWAETERFDVTGQPRGQGFPNERQLRVMVRQLLEDRFKLALHREKRELPVYALVATTTGPKLTRNESNPDGLPSLLFRGLGVLPGVNASMADFAGVMQYAVLDRPIVDRTGLAGRFDFTLTWTPDESQFRGLGVRVPPPALGDPNAPPGLFTAIQEQLGLKLESTNAPVEVLIIDRVERPSEN